MSSMVTKLLERVRGLEAQMSNLQVAIDNMEKTVAYNDARVSAIQAWLTTYFQYPNVARVLARLGDEINNKNI